MTEGFLGDFGDRFAAGSVRSEKNKGLAGPAEVPPPGSEAVGVWLHHGNPFPG